jgi:hypothetical protein
MGMAAVGPWPTTAWRAGAGPVTRVLRSWTNERGRWDHSEDWSQHGAHSLLNATQVRHEAGKGFADQRVFADFDSAIPRFESWRPSQPETLKNDALFAVFLGRCMRRKPLGFRSRHTVRHCRKLQLNGNRWV